MPRCGGSVPRCAGIGNTCCRGQALAQSAWHQGHTHPTFPPGKRRRRWQSAGPRASRLLRRWRRRRQSWRVCCRRRCGTPWTSQLAPGTSLQRGGGVGCEGAGASPGMVGLGGQPAGGATLAHLPCSSCLSTTSGCVPGLCIVDRMPGMAHVAVTQGSSAALDAFSPNKCWASGISTQPQTLQSQHFAVLWGQRRGSRLGAPSTAARGAGAAGVSGGRQRQKSCEPL